MAVVLVIDASGSMVWNDPDRVRVGAARKAIEYLRDEDRLALVEFASAPRLIMSMRPVGGPQERAVIWGLLEQVGQNGDTDILGGLRLAYQQLATAPSAHKFVILLSDGESDVPGVTDSPHERRNYFLETEGLLARYLEQGWKVHCIGFHEVELGPELDNISRKTGGEYHFVARPEGLKNIFANTLLAAKHSPEAVPVFHAAVVAPKDYQAGDSVVVEARLSIGEDCLLPGPYLEVRKLTLTVTGRGDSELPVAFAEADENGLFRAELVLADPGVYTITAAVDACYRGRELAATVDCGRIYVRESGAAPLRPIDFGRIGDAVKGESFAPAVGVYSLIVLFVFLSWRVRSRGRSSGELRVWAQKPGSEHRYSKYRLSLHQVGKRDIVVGTGNDRKAGFRLESAGREFRFIVRSARNPSLRSENNKKRGVFTRRKIVYEVVCLPGTVMQVDDGRLRTRALLFHGDIFEIGGYVFEFHCPSVGERSGGEDVLNAYASLIGNPGSGKSKSRTTATLRRE